MVRYADNPRAVHQRIVRAFLHGQRLQVGPRYWTDGLILRVWGNVVAAKLPSGIMLSDAGWRTLLTKNVLNELLHQIGIPGGYIRQVRRVWMLGSRPWPGQVLVPRQVVSRMPLNGVAINKAQYRRSRQRDPKLFAKKSFRTIPLGRHGKMGVVGCPKGKWDAARRRCRSGMQLQSILTPKSNPREIPHYRVRWLEPTSNKWTSAGRFESQMSAVRWAKSEDIHRRADAWEIVQVFPGGKCRVVFYNPRVTEPTHRKGFLGTRTRTMGTPRSPYIKVTPREPGLDLEVSYKTHSGKYGGSGGVSEVMIGDKVRPAMNPRTTRSNRAGYHFYATFRFQYREMKQPQWRAVIWPKGMTWTQFVDHLPPTVMGKIQVIECRSAAEAIAIAKQRVAASAARGLPGGNPCGARHNLDDREREMWVRNDEGLYNWWRSSRLSMRDFLRQNRTEIDAAINRVLGKGPVYKEPKRAFYRLYGQTNPVEYRTVDTSTLKGQEEADRLHQAGWSMGRSGLFSIQFYRRKCRKCGGWMKTQGKWKGVEKFECVRCGDEQQRRCEMNPCGKKNPMGVIMSWSCPRCHRKFRAFSEYAKHYKVCRIMSRNPRGMWDFNRSVKKK